jgi:hypothetical protein
MPRPRRNFQKVTMNSDEHSTYTVVQNPCRTLREAAGYTKEDIADKLQCSLREVDELEEGIPNSPPGWLFYVLPTLNEHADEYQEFKRHRRRVHKATIEIKTVPRTAEEFRHFLHDHHYTPQEFSAFALVPVAEVFYAMRTRIPSSVEAFFAA